MTASKRQTKQAEAPPPAQHKTKITTKLRAARQAYRLVKAPLPDDPYPPGNDDQTPSTGFLKDIQALGFKDYDTMILFLKTSISGVEDDDKHLLERTVQLLAKFPDHSREGKELTDGLISGLWNKLEHPPVSFLGDQYKYREANGSNNNPHLPQLGAANTFYARSVTPLVFQKPDLPDPADIFDLLMDRGETFDPHPAGISSMLFYMASIIIHDIFSSSSADPRINLTSSYLDLSPLYGRNAEEQKAVRTLKNGLLKPDSFSSKRVLGFPPGCGAFLLMFNRYHNYVVTQLAIINESNRFPKPAKDATSTAKVKYDNDLFQTGRLITCALYVNIILKDYIRTILALHASGSNWSLDPRVQKHRDIFGKGAPRGVGNQVAAEFNLIYRWHPTISQRDEAWTMNELTEALYGKDPREATYTEVLAALGAFETGIPSDPAHRTFGGLVRRIDGTFNDDELSKLISDSIEDLSGSFGPNRVPSALKAVEILGILQGRAWNVATLNEFRVSNGLKKHTTFEDINPDPTVAAKLRQLYDSPDSVELYPGLLSEKTKPFLIPGSGLCGNVTTTRSILSDAVTLVRGDRFYTIDYSPENLTNWGYNESNFDITVDQGHVMHKLILRAFPHHFANNSIYAHFPFVLPSENLMIQEVLGTIGNYNFEPPKRQPGLVIVKSHRAAKHILADQRNYRIPWGPTMNHLSNKSGEAYTLNFCLAGDGPLNAQSRLDVSKALHPDGWEDDVAGFFTVTTERLLKQYSGAIGQGQREIDIIRDVFNLATSNFAAAMFSLPIKTEASPHGLFSEQELTQILHVTFAAIFFDLDPVYSGKLRNGARQLAQAVGKTIEKNAKFITAPAHEACRRFVNKVVHAMEKDCDVDRDDWPTLALYGDYMIERLLGGVGESGVDEKVFGTILPMISSVGANQVQNLAAALDYYLGDGVKHLPALQRLAREGTKEADVVLMKYMLEGMRLRASIALIRNVAYSQTVTDYSPSLSDPADPTELNPLQNRDIYESTRHVHLPAGSRVMVDMISANHDAAAFPHPEKVMLDRPIDSYMFFGSGPHWCVGRRVSRVGMLACFKVIMKLENLKKADGPRGEQKSFAMERGPFWGGQVGDERNPSLGWTGLRIWMNADQSSFSGIPTGQRVRWDEECGKEEEEEAAGCPAME